MSLTQQHLHSLLRYDPDTGHFWWRGSGPGRDPTQPAGSVLKSGPAAGYRYICVNYKRYRAHRLAWFYVHGDWPAIIDHVDRDPDNNALSNLRPATQQQNTYNTKISKRNKSGAKGVWWEARRSKWYVTIRSPEGRNKYLGRFDTLNEAMAAFAEAEERYRGQFLNSRGTTP